MTLHDKNDALAAEMMAVGQAARDAARPLREANDATKTKAIEKWDTFMPKLGFLPQISQTAAMWENLFGDVGCALAGRTSPVAGG